jgi:hypothetical protein
MRVRSQPARVLAALDADGSHPERPEPAGHEGTKLWRHANSAPAASRPGAGRRPLSTPDVLGSQPERVIWRRGLPVDADVCLATRPGTGSAGDLGRRAYPTPYRADPSSAPKKDHAGRDMRAGAALCARLPAWQAAELASQPVSSGRPSGSTRGTLGPWPASLHHPAAVRAGPAQRDGASPCEPGASGDRVWPAPLDVIIPKRRAGAEAILSPRDE